MRYTPENPPVDAKDLQNYLYRELSRVGAVMELAVARNVEFLAKAPAKPREGMVTGADGTNWNPGAGKGVYAYYNSVWNKL